MAHRGLFNRGSAAHMGFVWVLQGGHNIFSQKITCLKVYINNNLTVYSLYVIVYQTQLFMTQV